MRLTDLLRDRAFLGLLLLAAAVRLVIGLNLWSADPLAQVPLSDPAYYHAWASALAQGESFRDTAPFWLPPLYPWLLSLLYRIVGVSIGAVLVVQLAAGLLSTALLILVAYRTVGRRAALAAGLLWTFYAPIVFFETRLLPVNLAILLGLVALDFSIRFAQRSSPEDSSHSLKKNILTPTVAGLFIGWASMARPNLLLVAPFVVAALLIPKRYRTQRVGGISALLIGVVLGLAPSMITNFQRSGDFIPVTANGGINFWFGNNEQAHGTFHAPSAEWGSIGTQREVSIDIATRELGSKTSLSDAEASAWWFARGRAFLFESPLQALRLWALKLADSLSSTEFGIQYFPAAIRQLAPSLWIGALPFGLILALGVIGFDRKLLRSATGTSVLLAWLLSGLAASLLYFTYSRFRLPIMIAWMPFAGHGATTLIDVWKRRAALPKFRTSLAAVLLALSFVPFEGAYPRQLKANTLLDAGLAAQQLGDDSRSIGLIESSLELVPVNPRAEVELGKRLRASGDEVGALTHFQRAWQMPGAYPPALFELCRLWVGAQSTAASDPDRAIRTMRTWLASDESQHLLSVRQDVQILLATAIIDRPTLALSENEARELTLSVLNQNPSHAAARQVLQFLDAR